MNSKTAKPSNFDKTGKNGVKAFPVEVSLSRLFEVWHEMKNWALVKGQSTVIPPGEKVS